MKLLHSLLSIGTKNPAHHHRTDGAPDARPDPLSVSQLADIKDRPIFTWSAQRRSDLATASRGTVFA